MNACHSNTLMPCHNFQLHETKNNPHFILMKYKKWFHKNTPISLFQQPFCWTAWASDCISLFYVDTHSCSCYNLELLFLRWLSFNLITRLVNSLAPGKFEWNFRHVIFKLILVIDDWGISCAIALTWKLQDLTDDESTLVQVMAWCHRAASHYMRQCWPSSRSPYDVTRPQWVKCGMKLLTHAQTSTLQPLKFGNAYVIWCHIIWWI